MALRPETLAQLSPPNDVEDLGLPVSLAEELFLRRLFTDRSSTIVEAANALCVTPAVSQQLATVLRGKSLLEFQGMEGRDYRIALTEQGNRLASDLMKVGRHSAPMPVSLNRYRTIVEEQKADVAIDRAGVKQAFSDLVVDDSIIDQIGPAFLDGGPVFLYGPTGTGKTSLAERMSRLHNDYILVPRIVAIDGDLVTVFDPAVHKPAEGEHGIDPRWVVCERPLLISGGEFSLSAMDLQLNTDSGLSTAPIQMQANNGILVIDDFGRQAPRPDEILNRWILPLSRGYDLLRPKSGAKVQVPFQVKLVVSTNMAPRSLGDEAFLRRLRNKVYVGPCSDKGFNWILARAAEERQMEIDADTAAYLADVTRRYMGDLRPYVAVDCCDIAISICDYEGLPRGLTKPLVRRIAAMCFIESDGEAATMAATQDSEPGTQRRSSDTMATSEQNYHQAPSVGAIRQ